MSRTYLIPRGLTLLAAIAVLHTAPLRAQDIQPPDLWDIATGDQIPASQLVATKSFGALVSGLGKKKSPAASSGIHPGDIILAVDGLRTYGSREFQIARYRHPMSPTMTLLINHKGDLAWHKIYDLTPGHITDFSFDTTTERDGFLNELESLGVTIPDASTRVAVHTMPERAAAELSVWRTSSPKKTSADTAWVADLLTLYSALQRRDYSHAAPPAHEPPLPYFQRLEKFYLAVAATNQPKEIVPSLKRSGETAEFYTLALPVPEYRPLLGDLNLSDLRFKSLLTRVYADPANLDPDILTAAQKYAGSGDDTLEQYLNQVRAALLDQPNQGGWPYRSWLVQSAVAKDLLIQQLQTRMKDATAPDWPLHAYAMIALKLLSGHADEAGSLIDQLAKISPYLAATAADQAINARASFRFNIPNYLRPIRSSAGRNRHFLGNNPPPLFEWASNAIWPRAFRMTHELQINPLPTPEYILTSAPNAEIMALESIPLPPHSPPAPPLKDPAEAKDDPADDQN